MATVFSLDKYFCHY